MVASAAKPADGDIEEELPIAVFVVSQMGDDVAGKHRAEGGGKEEAMRAEDDVVVMVFEVRPVQLWETMSGLACDQPGRGLHRYCNASLQFVL